MRRFRFVAGLLAVLLVFVLTPPQVARAVGDLELTQTAAPDPVAVGQELTWTLTIRNLGDEQVNSVEVNDNFNQYGATSEFVSVTPSRGTCTNETNTFNCQIGTMGPGSTETVRLTVRVLSEGTVVNVGDVTGWPDSDFNNNHVEGTVTPGEAADLQVTKAANPTAVAPGEVVRYTLTVTNRGPGTASGVVLSDPLPSGLTEVAVTPTGQCSVSGGSEVSCSLASLAPGDDFTATVTARVDPGFTGSELRNTATVTSTTPDADPSNNTATAVVEVAAAGADLSVNKTMTPARPVPGEAVRFTLTVRNDGPGVARDATLSDPAVDGLTVTSASSELGSCTVAGGATSCSFGDLPAGAVVRVTIDATVAASATGALVNRATVDSDTDDPDESNNSDSVTGQLSNSADLAIAKTGSPATAGSGDRVSYVLRVTNHGPSVARSAVVTDELPDGLGYDAGSCSADQGSCSASGGRITFQLGTIAVGDSVTARFTATVDADAPDGVLTNTANVEHAGDDPVESNDSAEHRLNVDGAADVALTKIAAPSPAMAGQAITFTLVATNNGPGAADDLVLTDRVPAQVDVTGATASDGSCDSGTSNAVRCTLGSLDPGETWTVTVTGRLAGDTPVGPLVNVATVAVLDDPALSNNTATAIVGVRARADLTIAKSAPAIVIAGERLSYRVTVENDGPSTARDAVVLDQLPPGTTFVSGGGGGVSCAVEEDAPGLVRCPLGDLPAGDDATLTITVQVDPAAPAGTSLTNRAQVSSATPGVSDERLATAVTEVVAEADLRTAKTVLPGVLVAGGHASYVIRVHNDGPSAAVRPRVTDQLPAGLTAAALSPAGGSCTETAGLIACERDGLAAGATWTIVVRVAVDAAASGPITNSATASAETTDPEPDNNTGTVTAQVEAGADLVMIKRSLVPRLGAGETAVFVLTVVNLGPATATEVTIADSLPAGLTPTSATNPACSIAGQDVACRFPALDPGQTRSTVVNASVAADVASGELVNTARAGSATPDPDLGNNSDEASVTVFPIADLALDKSVDPGEAAPGDEVRFTLSVSNAGPSGAADVALSDELPAGLTVQSVDAAEPFGCDTTGRRVNCTAATLSVGEYSLVIVATVDDGASGTLRNTARVRAETNDPNPGNNTASATLAVSDDPGDGGGGGGGGGDGELPQTGGGQWPLGYAIGALVVATAGAALLVAGRRRSRS